MYSFGMEEEYFLFDAKTRHSVRRANKRFLVRAQKQLGDHVMTEMLQSQLEVATPPCDNAQEARAHLAHYRRTLGQLGAEYGLGLAAMGTFPLAYWPEQVVTRKARYGAIMDDLQMVGYRNMLCGMHVHVAVPDVDTRINLIMRLTPYLPLLLALTTSSPFWQGHLTGLVGYRLAAYDELPRTGLPELFRTNDDYREFVAALTWAKIIPDESYIWWAIRPSLNNPTLELRAPDSCTLVEDSIAIAALYRTLAHHLYVNRWRNCDLDAVQRAIIVENKWQAQRYGVHATFAHEEGALTVADMLERVISDTAVDAAALGCAAELNRCRAIVGAGTSADAQLAVFEAHKPGENREAALRAVTDWIVAATLQ